MTDALLLLATTNDRKLIRRVVDLAGLSGGERSLSSDGAFGAALFASSVEVLHQRAPLAAGQPLDSFIDPGVRASRLMAVGDGHEQPFVPHRTQPFRYKGWVFGMVGDTPPASQPTASEREEDFVRQIGGLAGPVQLLMARVVYRLQRATQGTQEPDARAIVNALTDATSGLQGFERFAVAVTHEAQSVVIARQIPVAYRGVSGRTRSATLDPSEAAAIQHLRGTVVVAGRAPRHPDFRLLGADQALVVNELPPAQTVAV